MCLILKNALINFHSFVWISYETIIIFTISYFYIYSSNESRNLENSYPLLYLITLITLITYLLYDVLALFTMGLVHL